MKKILLSCIILLFYTFTNAQVTIGGGTSQGGIAPIDTYYGFTYTQQILTKAEINASSAGNITGLKFNLPTSTTLANSNEWVVYLGHTTKTIFDTTSDWIPVASLTEVFNGTVTNSGGSVTITLTTPFAYNNTDNLVIAIDENKTNYDNPIGARFYTFTGVTNSTLYSRSDSVNPSPSAPPTGSRSSVKSVTTLLGLTPASAPLCPTVTAPALDATNVAVKPTFTWNTTPNASTYKLSIGTTAGGTDVLNNQDVGNVTSYTLTNFLNFNTLYYYTITAENAAGTSTSCTERKFTTIATLPCPTVNLPTTAQTDLSFKPTFNWTANTSATGYYLTIGTTAGGNDILNNFDVGNVTTYTLTSAQQLSANTTYYYIINAYNGGVVSTGCAERSFTTGAVAPPANDDCTGAIDLTVNADLNCTTVTSGSTAGATLSMAATPCSGSPDDDVWYSFVATEDKHVVSLLNVPTGSDAYFQVLSGACGSLVSVLCSDPNSATVIGLVPGTKYYIRVYSVPTAVSVLTFDICIGTIPPIPANDTCSNAITIPSAPYSYTQSDAISATNNSGFVTACSTGTNDGVWYSFIGDGTPVTIKVTTTTAWDPEVSVYSGSCGSLTCQGSVDTIGSAVGSIETYTFTSTANTTYYINVAYWSSSTDGAEGNFKIDVTGGVLGTANVVKDMATIYPNPFIDIVNISNYKDVQSISVSDISGRNVKNIMVSDKAVDLSSLKSGVYVLQLKMKDGSVKTVKAIKK